MKRRVKIEKFFFYYLFLLKFFLLRVIRKSLKHDWMVMCWWTWFSRWWLQSNVTMNQYTNILFYYILVIEMLAAQELFVYRKWISKFTTFRLWMCFVVEFSQQHMRKQQPNPWEWLTALSYYISLIEYTTHHPLL